MDIDKNLAERLETLVKESGYSIKEFSDLIETPTTNIYGYLNGKRPIGLKIINKIKHVIPDLNLNWLLYNQGSPKLDIDFNDVNEPNSFYGSSNSLDSLINDLVENKINALENKIDLKIKELKSTIVFGDNDSDMIEKLKKIIDKETH